MMKSLAIRVPNRNCGRKPKSKPGRLISKNRRSAMADRNGPGEPSAADRNPAERDNAMSKAIEQGKAAGSLGAARRSMTEALARLRQLDVRPSRARAAEPGRMVVLLDLTASRGLSLAHARRATTGIFEAIKGVGSVLVKLIYYRGQRECKVSDWVGDPEILNQAMLRLSCRAGATQIARALRLLTEADTPQLSAVVFIGDHCEDDPDALLALAKALGQKGTQIFVFHECDDDSRSVDAQPVFQCMAEASGGIYCEFKPDSGAVLRDLLSSLAAFAAGGSEAVKCIEAPVTAAGKDLQRRLLIGAAEISRPNYKRLGKA
jgi:hypothetical protein